MGFPEVFLSSFHIHSKECVIDDLDSEVPKKVIKHQIILTFKLALLLSSIY